MKLAIRHIHMVNAVYLEANILAATRTRSAVDDLWERTYAAASDADMLIWFVPHYLPKVAIFENVTHP